MVATGIDLAAVALGDELHVLDTRGNRAVGIVSHVRPRLIIEAFGNSIVVARPNRLGTLAEVKGLTVTAHQAPMLFGDWNDR